MKMAGAIKNRATQDFKADLMLAQKAEQALAAWIDSQGAYKSTKIVNEKGYDILCHKHDGSVRKIEIKRDFWVDKYQDGKQDRRATDNICVEIWSNFGCGNLGWIYYSDSDYIFYVGNENIYVIDTVKLKGITQKIINIGEANKVEPSMKNKSLASVAKIQYTAHHNGNFKVRSALLKKQWLDKLGCISRIISREESGFNKIAIKYEV